MAGKAGSGAFDPRVFLATVSQGRSLFEYRSEQGIFTQGDPANSVFYIVQGKVKIVVTSEQGKEAVIAVLGEGDSSAKDALPATAAHGDGHRHDEDRRHAASRRRTMIRCPS